MELTEQETELLGILDIIDTKGKKYVQEMTETIRQLFRYLTTQFDWNAKYIIPEYLVIPDVNGESIHIYKYLEDEKTYEQIYDCNLYLCRINGESYYEIRKRFGIIK